MPRQRIVIQGKVQGVGFRYFAREQAHAMGIGGWVRNLPDRTVEIEAQHEDIEVLEAYARMLTRGPALARVQHVDVEDVPEEKGHNEFGMRF